MKKRIAIVLAVMMLLASITVLAACGGDKPTDGDSTSAATDAPDNGATEATQPGEPSGEGAEDVKTWTDGDFSFTAYFKNTNYEPEGYVVIKNNGAEAKEVTVNASVKDASGAEIGSDFITAKAVAPGRETMRSFWFFDIDAMASIEYTVEFADPNGVEDATPNLTVTDTFVDGSEPEVTVDLTNNGDKAVKEPMVYVLFFDANGGLVAESSGTPDETEIDAGASATVHVYGFAEFDHYEVYVSGVCAAD